MVDHGDTRQGGTNSCHRTTMKLSPHAALKICKAHHAQDHEPSSRSGGPVGGTHLTCNQTIYVPDNCWCLFVGPHQTWLPAWRPRSQSPRRSCEPTIAEPGRPAEVLGTTVQKLLEVSIQGLGISPGNPSLKSSLEGAPSERTRTLDSKYDGY